MTYTSSIINKYGDTDNVKKDTTILTEILSRQGMDLVIDCMAEYIGSCAIKYNMTDQDRNNLIKVLPEQLKESLQERL